MKEMNEREIEDAYSPGVNALIIQAVKQQTFGPGIAAAGYQAALYEAGLLEDSPHTAFANAFLKDAIAQTWTEIERLYELEKKA